jgi:quercetin dioxygenase-like cupin family protein
MQISDIPFNVIDWGNVKTEEHKGETGTAQWQVKNFGDIRVRMVEYSPGYSADHWCRKGHIILCLEGLLTTELDDGRKFILSPGMSYHVSDNNGAHRSSTALGAKLFIID